MKRCLLIKKVYFSNDGLKPIIIGNPHIFNYTETDEMCMRNDMDEIVCGLPKNGDKTFTLKSGYHARLLVRLL